MIFKDRLDIKAFNDERGKNARRAEVLDLSQIAKYFQNKGYKVLTLEQIWRHATGLLEKDSQKFFLKMASTEDIGERTENEVSWNCQIYDALKKAGIDNFNVPQIFQTGRFEGRFFYLSSYHEGPLLSLPSYIRHLERWLDHIVEINLFLLSLENITFKKDEYTKPIPERWEAYFKKIQSWQEAVSEHPLEDILRAVEQLKETFRPAINHGDFTPKHMIAEGPKLILIDAEHASSKSPKYYDICYFYHRLYTSFNQPALAKRYLRTIWEKLPRQEKEVFEISIRPLIAARIIGGFWDAKNGGAKDFHFHYQLKEDFQKGALF